MDRYSGESVEKKPEPPHNRVECVCYREKENECFTCRFLADFPARRHWVALAVAAAVVAALFVSVVGCKEVTEEVTHVLGAERVQEGWICYEDGNNALTRCDTLIAGCCDSDPNRCRCVPFYTDCYDNVQACL